MTNINAGALAPIIIKRKKVVKGGGHHGGAWKVAYADFVTAMMAFFLLMWLLNATTEEQRKGIADYFNPTIPISRISGGGSDALNGSSIFTDDTYAQMGTGADNAKSVSPFNNKEETEPSDQANGTPSEITDIMNDSLTTLREELAQKDKKLSEHLLIKMSPEGIVLEIIESDGVALFDVGSSNPSIVLQTILPIVAQSFSQLENKLKIVGHTDSRKFRNTSLYDNWNLSADRANTARRLLVHAGINPDRITEVSGKADTDPLVEQNLKAPQNRRISITILSL